MKMISFEALNAMTCVITGSESNGTRFDMFNYRRKKDIDMFFEGCGCQIPPGVISPGLSRFEATYKTLCYLNNNLTMHGKLIKLITIAAIPQVNQSGNEIDVAGYLNKSLKIDGYELQAMESGLVLIKTEIKGLLAGDLCDFDTVNLETHRILKNIANDPEDSITAASSLVESMCRSILLELKLEIPKDRSLQKLMQAVQLPLGISPKKQCDGFPSEVAEHVRTILGALATIAQGIATLRTCGGDAHGHERGAPRIDVRIARLAVNAASTLAFFLLETWQMKMQRGLTNR